VLHQADTIVALSTPPGRGGIGVIRISGPDALPILRKLIASRAYEPEPNYLSLKSLVDPESGDTLDEALVCYFKGPHSFTGEDVVELHCHGSPVLLRALIDVALKLDARLAEPGEFSLRAVNNGRLKLAEAEAIRDLIEAQTEAALSQATRQLKGAISNSLQPAKDELLKIIVRLESSIEFVEDDLPALEIETMLAALASLKRSLSLMADTFNRGRLLRDGLKVTLIGSPNAGKSSIFNKLLGHGRAIVHEIPGTTRDTISEPVSVDGVPVLLVDTAGIRTSSDQIEAIGVERTKREAADSDLLLVVIDGSRALTDEDRSVLAEVDSRPHVVALNKSDLDSFSIDRLDDDFGEAAKRYRSVAVSAKTEAGLEHLRAAILAPFANGHTAGEGLLVTNARHHDLLARSIDSISSAEGLFKSNAGEEIVLVGLHSALRYLGEITGETTPDEVLGRIFSTFCIGK
jgi:tRNA modification GTPase